MDSSREFVLGLEAKGGFQLAAVAEDGCVLGWCDVVRGERESVRHTGTVGMGLVKEARGLGLGRRLLETLLERARTEGFERVELEVFASNAPAVALYRKLGFTLEGRKVKARKIDGRHDDILMMAVLF